MYYEEYAIAARTHYKSCSMIYKKCVKSKILDDDCPSDILYRIYYLCGHVVECTAVYLIYRHFKWEYNPRISNWKGKYEHIHTRYNIPFTQSSHIDFYPISIAENKNIVSGGHRFFGIASGNERTEDFYNVQKHEFQKYVKGIIWVQLPQEVPYLRQTCGEDSMYQLAINLLDCWTPDLRYYYDGRKSGYYIKSMNSSTIRPIVDVNSVGQLLDVCGKIVSVIPSGLQL